MINDPRPDHTSVVSTALILRDHLGGEAVVANLADGVIHDTGAAERRLTRMPVGKRTHDFHRCMHAKHVQGVVVTERILTVVQKKDRPTPTMRPRTSAPSSPNSRRRRDGDEPGDATRQRAEYRLLTFDQPFGEHP